MAPVASSRAGDAAGRPYVATGGFGRDLAFRRHPRRIEVVAVKRGQAA
jgi:hypothetical protein